MSTDQQRTELLTAAHDNTPLPESGHKSGSSAELLQMLIRGLSIMLITTVAFGGGFWLYKNGGQLVGRAAKPVNVKDFILWANGSEKTWDEIQAENARKQQEFFADLEQRQQEMIREMAETNFYPNNTGWRDR